MRDVRRALEQGDVEVGVEFAGETLVCPACGAACPGYGRRRRAWRHLDTMQYRTLVRAEVPRVRCSEQCGRIQMVAMDMWPAYIGSVREHTEALIAFDRFHVAQHLGAAVDRVRRSENRALRQQGDDRC